MTITSAFCLLPSALVSPLGFGVGFKVPDFCLLAGLSVFCACVLCFLSVLSLLLQALTLSCSLCCCLASLVRGFGFGFVEKDRWRAHE